MKRLVLAWLCDEDFNPIDDLWIKTLEVDFEISKDWYFVLDWSKYLFYSDKQESSDHSYTQDMLCPYCDHVMDDPREYDEDWEACCWECDRCFSYEKHISVTYSTKSIKWQ